MTKEQKEFYKQLHHIIRLYDILSKDVNVYKYSEKEKQHMLDIKRGRFPTSLEEAEALRDKYVLELNKLYHAKKIAYLPQEIDYNLLDNLMLTYMCRKETNVTS